MMVGSVEQGSSVERGAERQAWWGAMREVVSVMRGGTARSAAACGRERRTWWEALSLVGSAWQSV